MARSVKTTPKHGSGHDKYLIECKQREVRTLDLIAGHVNLLRYVVILPLPDICNDAEERRAEGVKASTINRSLQVGA